MYFQFIFIKALAEKFCQCFDSFFIGSTLTLHFFGQIRINTLKLYFLMFLLKTGNKCTVNIMLQDNANEILNKPGRHQLFVLSGLIVINSLQK